MKIRLHRIVSLLAAVCFTVCCVCFAQAADASGNPFDGNPDYKLKRVVIFSRHGIRSPLESRVETLKTLTPHKWIEWSSEPEELTVRGSIVETLFGQYFKRVLEKIGFIPHNWQPGEGETRFRSNSFQRTVATARYFASGLLPCADVKVEHKNPIGEIDPDIYPMSHFTSEEYRKQIIDDILKHMDVTKFSDILDDIRDGIKVLDSVLDYRNSEHAKKNSAEHFPAEKYDISANDNGGITASGDLSLAVGAVDALSLQYLEGAGDRLSSFGQAITEKEADDLNHIIDVYYHTETAPYSIAVNISHPLLVYLKDELKDPVRKFSFTCGHDTNVVPLTSALRVEPYNLKNTVGSNIAPIGCKLVFSVYDGPDGKEYAKVNMMYLSADQIRDAKEITESNPPMNAELSLEGLKKNADGYYALDDVIGRFDEAVDAFWKLPGNSKGNSKDNIKDNGVKKAA